MSNDAMTKWAEKAYDLIHPAYKAGLNRGIPEDWLAGLIFVECSRLDPKASRFEPHVFESVMWVKEGHKSTAFPGFNSGPIHSFIMRTHDKQQLRSLASSWGLGQIMGYHFINKWGIPPVAYKNQNFKDSVQYTLYFMADGMKFAKNFKQLVTWHNTGSTTGKTYSPKYCDNAEKARVAYKAVMEARNEDLHNQT